MDLKRLRTFVAVAEEKGFGRAAERLALAQPAVSKHVRDLEDHFGGPLFERRTDGVHLTHAGEQLLAGARELIGTATSVETRVKAVTRGEVGALTLGFNETVSWETIIPKTVYEFGHRYPNVKLAMEPMNSVTQVAALQARRIDGGFLFHRDSADTSLTGIPVLYDPMLLAVPVRSKWAKRPPSRLADLDGEPFIWIPRYVAPPYYDRVVGHCRDAGLKLEIVQEGYDGSALLGLVAVGMGLSFVPQAARARCPKDVTLVSVPDLDFKLTMEFVWRVGEDHSALRRFIETVAELAA